MIEVIDVTKGKYESTKAELFQLYVERHFVFEFYPESFPVSCIL